MGRRAPTRMGSGRSALIAVERFYKCCSHRFAAGRIRPVCGPATGWAWRGFSHQGGRPTGPWLQRFFTRLYFFGDGGAAGLGAFAAPAGAGVGAGLASSSSTSKIRVELAARSGLTDLSP